MSDTKNGLFITSSGAIVYGSGVSMLTVYPNATGYYRAYLELR
jgi:hypothetical protein